MHHTATHPTGGHAAFKPKYDAPLLIMSGGKATCRCSTTFSPQSLQACKPTSPSAFCFRHR
eukprot:979860-Rhodomonas_salina.1